MNIAIISFTKRGRELSFSLREALKEKGTVTLAPKQKKVSEWAGRQFEAGNAMIFIGACGIAVRAIAPHVKDKLYDSPVLVIDEYGQYVIPILSGHVGGANELSRFLAKQIGASAVITTATDLNGKFAVDVFAKKNGLAILDKAGIVKVSAKVLNGERVTVSVEGYDKTSVMEDLEKELPKDMELVSYPPEGEADIVISTDREVFSHAVLPLKPKEYVLGIGCKKGKSTEEIEVFIGEILEKMGITEKEIAGLFSIDKKKEEEGILRWAAKKKIPYQTFSAEELARIPGVFEGSEFVKEQVGIDNVCERAALAGCKAGGCLVLKKQIKNGITLAAAKRKWSIDWRGDTENEA